MSNQDNNALLEQKKELLKKEIVENSYDQDKFIQFCLAKKKNGDDMNNWTIPELKDIIVQFIKNEKEEEKATFASLNSTNSKLSEEAKKKNEEINSGIQKLTISKTKIEDKDTKTIEIICRKLEKTILNENPKIVVTVENPKSIETNFLSSNYVNYDVRTSELNYLVKRRYSDFEWLRVMLVKYCPGYMVPPLPNKKIGSRRFEDSFIEKRMKFLQKFMNAVMQHDIFKATEPLLYFLQMTERGQFESKMKEYNSYQPSAYIEDHKAFAGKVIIASEEEDNEKYFVNINNYFKLQSQVFDRLNQNMKIYYHNMSLACGNLEDIQKDFDTLYILNSRVVMKEQITKTFEEFGLFFRDWKKTIYKQNELVKLHLKDFFRFIKMEGIAYEELCKHRDEIREKYVAENTKLVTKKEKLWTLGDISKWEIVDEFNKLDKVLLTKDKNYAIVNMCTKESLNVEKIRKQLGYANRMNIEELKKMININSDSFIKNLKTFVEEFYPTLTDAINVWSGLATFSNMN